MILFFVGCTFLNKDRNSNQDLVRLRSDYYNYLENTCIEDKYYDGLRNTFQYSACLLDEKVLNYQLDINRLAFLWSDKDFYEKRTEIDKSISKETVIFLSFFSPSRKLVDLDKKSTNWKLYVGDGTKRIAASSVIKLPNEYDEIKNQYPIHTHWGVAYKVKFPVAIAMLNRKNINFTITSREGYSKKTIPIGNLD